LPQSARPEDKLPALLQNYRRELRREQPGKACAILEDMAALSLFAASREYRQLGGPVSPDALVEQLRSSFQPHENRSGLSNRNHEIATTLTAALKLTNATGIRSEAQKENQAEAFMTLALTCAKAVIRYEADELKQTREQEDRLEPAMEMEME
jgi:hypothetical protein